VNLSQIILIQDPEFDGVRNGFEGFYYFFVVFFINIGDYVAYFFVGFEILTYDIDIMLPHDGIYFR
jgi:hypothetical protein